MLYKDQLFNIKNYTILMQYLAIGESIIINNGLANIEIYMKDAYDIKAQNLNFPQFPPYNYNEEMTLENVLLGIIPQLQKQEPKEFKQFKNRWEEIKTITMDTVTMNKMKNI